MTLVIVLLVSLAFVLLGMAVLGGLNRLFTWRLHLLTTHSGFLQAWVAALQTIAVAATLGYTALQLKSVQATVRTNTVELMVAAHRDLMGKILEYPELYDALSTASTPPSPRAAVYFSMLFNHGFDAFTLRQSCFIDDDWWAAIVRDMRDVLRKAPLKAWWGHVKQLYPERYQVFIESEILDNQKENRRCGNS